jgi:hypothetical protein
MPEEYREFFVAAAGTTGALVGLLFVAVSVFPDEGRQDTTRGQFHARSSAALLVFTNALVISMAALVPNVSLGWWAIATGISALVFARDSTFHRGHDPQATRAPGTPTQTGHRSARPARHRRLRGLRRGSARDRSTCIGPRRDRDVDVRRDRRPHLRDSPGLATSGGARQRNIHLAAALDGP